MKTVGKEEQTPSYGSHHIALGVYLQNRGQIRAYAAIRAASIYRPQVHTIGVDIYTGSRPPSSVIGKCGPFTITSIGIIQGIERVQVH
jgi:hypothetical protein